MVRMVRVELTVTPDFEFIRKISPEKNSGTLNYIHYATISVT
jgi:hypothetical protein